MSMDPSTRHNRFKPVAAPKIAKNRKEYGNKDARFWRSLQFPISVQEAGPVNYVDVSPASPHLVAVTGSARIQIYDPADMHEAVKTFTKFRALTYGGRFRRDGRLLGAGSDDGALKVWDVQSKTQLRSFDGAHEAPVHRIDFGADQRHVIGFGDDQAISVWDLAAQERIAFLKEHTDYVRAGNASESTSELMVSGSYDHTVKLWDRRKEGSVVTVTHGSPVDAVVFFPNDALMASAGGHEVRIWDLLAGGRLLSRITPHNKTVTSLGFSNDRKRLVTASLDGHVKFHDLTTFSCVHHIKFPSPILAASVAPDDTFVVAAMTDGLVQFLHRKEQKTEEEKRQELLSKPGFGYLKYMGGFTPAPSDLVVKRDPKTLEQKHDRFLRRFEHSRALDEVLKPYVVRKFPSKAYAVITELKRRGALRAALAGRDAKGLAPIIKFVSAYFNDWRYAATSLEVANELLDLYGEGIGTQPNVDRLFVDLRKRVDREARNLRELLQLRGALDLILMASKGHRKPTLRSEELMLKDHRKDKAETKVAGLNLTVDKVIFG